MDKVYVFDLDDTLVDSHRRYESGILKVLDDAGVSYDAETLIPVINPMGYAGTAVHFASLGVPGTPEEIATRLMDNLERFYTRQVGLAPGVRDYLQRLHGAGNRLFVLTASPHRLVDGCLQANGIVDLFEQVWCVDDIGYNKGQTQLYDQVTAIIGCAPEDVVFYDDGATAIRTAREAGWHTVGVCPSYAVESQGMEELAHECIVDFEELV